MTLQLTTAQLARAEGVLLGMACGDALGAGYEFGPPLGPDVSVAMNGGGGYNWEPGEWTDDTSMAIAIAEVSATQADLRIDRARDQIAARWADWAAEAKDVGIQTRAVLSKATRAAHLRGETYPTAGDMVSAAAEHDARTHRSGGNGSLMRTAPIALAYLDDPDALVLAAAEISAMTHHDPEAGEACALWCLAIRHAVLEGALDIRSGLEHLPEGRAGVWAARLDEAERSRPADFDNNGWAVQALQGAWSAVTTTKITATAPAGPDSSPSSLGPAHFKRALESAVRGGNDTDTVAAIAGALVGGLYGASAVPSEWRGKLHGWPGLRARDLVRLGMMIASGGRPGSDELVSKPADIEDGSWQVIAYQVTLDHPPAIQHWFSIADIVKLLRRRSAG